MGRKAGVTADETREALLRAAAVIFARDGFEGASVADIAAEAGTSSGPIYTHFGGKAELFVATIRTHTDRALDHVMGRVDRGDAASVLAAFGRALPDRPSRGDLLVEAIVAARRDPVVAELVARAFSERERELREMVQRGQKASALDDRVSPDAVARFSLVVALGTLLVQTVDLDPVGADDWARLIDGITATMRPR